MRKVTVEFTQGETPLQIDFAATGATPRLYRMYFKKDLLQTLVKVEKGLKFDGVDGLQKMSEKEQEELKTTAIMENFDFGMIEELAWICAKTADPKIDEIDIWLEQFEAYELLTHMQEIMLLIFDSLSTNVESKKKLQEVVK